VNANKPATTTTSTTAPTIAILTGCATATVLLGWSEWGSGVGVACCCFLGRRLTVSVSLIRVPKGYVKAPP
jgi:hypothetical protein